MAKRMVWRYEKGWVPFEDDQRRRISLQTADSYALQVAQAQSTRYLRDIHDRFVVDSRLEDNDKLRLGNSIMEVWKVLSYKESNEETKSDLGSCC